MIFIIKLLSVLISIEFIYIFLLETVKTSSTKTQQVFQLTPQDSNHPTVKTVFKNLGMYNLMIACLILLALITSNYEMMFFLFIAIDIIAIYGAITSQLKILFLQGTMPTISLIMMTIMALS